MRDPQTNSPGSTGEGRSFRRTVLDDLRRADLRSTFSRDLRDLYYFYLDDERRARLARMNRLQRWILVSFWILKSMILRLTPVRRLLLLLSVFLSFQEGFSFQAGDMQVSIHSSALGVLLLLLILMLELKDKLLARDELEIGRIVQRALLPGENPLLDGWEIWLYTQPANEVGGDLVDYLALAENRLGLALGDVAGKGLGAALLMARLQATLRALAPDTPSLAELGRRMNTIICRDGMANRFATLLYVELESGSGAVRLLNAGHMPPLILSAGAVETLPPVAPCLGILAAASFTEQEVEMAPGGLFLAYSDGVSEARGEQGDFFGEERLRGLLPGLQGCSAEEAGRRLLVEVERFTGRAPRSDDLSLMVLRREG